MPHITLVRTCDACPEQYDAFDDQGTQVGYLRLRHGEFYVEAPACGGEMVYAAHPEGDGEFEAHEREYYLRFAVDALLRWVRGEWHRPAAPLVAYTIVTTPPAQLDAASRGSAVPSPRRQHGGPHRKGGGGGRARGASTRRSRSWPVSRRAGCRRGSDQKKSSITRLPYSEILSIPA